MLHLSIEDLQKLSAEAISALPGPVAIRQGDQTVALLAPVKPVKPVDLRRLQAALAQAEELAKGRDWDADTAALEAMGVDPTHWTPEAIAALRADSKK